MVQRQALSSRYDSIYNTSRIVLLRCTSLSACIEPVVYTMREEGCCSFRPLKELCIYQALGTEADDDFITIATFRFGGLNDPDCVTSVVGLSI